MKNISSLNSWCNLFFQKVLIINKFRLFWAILWRLIEALAFEGWVFCQFLELFWPHPSVIFENQSFPPKIIVNWAETIRNRTFLPENWMFVNKNPLKHVTPMKNRNLDMQFLECFGKIWISLIWWPFLNLKKEKKGCL